MQRGATETGSASSQVLSAAQSLSGDSNRLKLEVGKFLELGAGCLMSAATANSAQMPTATISGCRFCVGITRRP